MQYDIVYILKNDIDGSELKYSLRSLVNFPHGRVWFYGGKPKGITPDRMVEFEQEGRTKWQRSTNSLRMACKNDEITSSFWLFNDDFYCMKPCDGIPPFYNGDLYQRILQLKSDHKRQSGYVMQLEKMVELLDVHGLGVKNYGVHMPMLIDRAKALVVLKEFDPCPMFRSLYGNSCNIGGVNREDVKLSRLDEEPDHDADWLSTSNTSFMYGAVGEYIRSAFPEASEYER